VAVPDLEGGQVAVLRLHARCVLYATIASYTRRRDWRIPQMSDIWNILWANFRELRTGEVRRTPHRRSCCIGPLPRGDPSHRPSVATLLRSVRVFHFGCRTSKLVPNFEAPSPTTMLQGVHADPPSPYLCAIWSDQRASPDLIADAPMPGYSACAFVPSAAVAARSEGRAS
jgi:hypothetical protein